MTDYFNVKVKSIRFPVDKVKSGTKKFDCFTPRLSSDILGTNK